MRRWPRPLVMTLLGWAVLGTGGCVQNAPPARPGSSSLPAAKSWDARFRDVAREAGIQYSLGHGGKSPLSILETAPGGCALVDLDQDGWLDVVLVGPPRCSAYRNLGNGRFQDITTRLGLRQTGSWMGCTVGDYNGDRFPDLLLTGYRHTLLLKNERGQRLVDVTQDAGLDSSQWTTSAAFCDVDADGWLDLYVGAYVDYRLGQQDLCQVGLLQSACGPELYAAEVGRLYRNRSNGRFEDVTRASGLQRASGKTWGVAFADYDDDGRPDLYLANDQVAGNLYRNLGGFRFQDQGMDSGTAYDAGGGTQGGMGVDWGDANGDGRLDLFVATYAHQVKELYRNEGGGFFQPSSAAVGLAQPSLNYVTFGVGFLDANNDGDLDLLLANGHVRDNVAQADATQGYAQPLQLLANQGDGTFRDVSSQSGAPFGQPLVGRGTAFGDYDNDGRVDVLVMNLEGTAQLLHNERPSESGAWIAFQLDAGGHNREGIGARVTVEGAGSHQIREVTRGRSVLSASDCRAYFGLGSSPAIDRITVRWPGGATEQWAQLAVGQLHTLRQGEGQRSRKVSVLPRGGEKN